MSDPETPVPCPFCGAIFDWHDANEHRRFGSGQPGAFEHYPDLEVHDDAEEERDRDLRAQLAAVAGDPNASIASEATKRLPRSEQPTEVRPWASNLSTNSDIVGRTCPNCKSLLPHAYPA